MYTLSITTILFTGLVFYNEGFNEDSFRSLPGFITVFCLFFVPAVNISEVTIVKIDLINKIIFITTNVVFYKKTKEIEAVEFEYVVIHKSNFSYIITLWYKNNRHLKLLSFNKKSKALLYSKILCQQINVSLLDRTSGKPIWIENSNL